MFWRSALERGQTGLFGPRCRFSAVEAPRLSDRAGPTRDRIEDYKSLGRAIFGPSHPSSEARPSHQCPVGQTVPLLATFGALGGWLSCWTRPEWSPPVSGSRWRGRACAAAREEVLTTGLWAENASVLRRNCCSSNRPTPTTVVSGYHENVTQSCGKQTFFSIISSCQTSQNHFDRTVSLLKHVPSPLSPIVNGVLPRRLTLHSPPLFSLLRRSPAFFAVLTPSAAGVLASVDRSESLASRAAAIAPTKCAHAPFSVSVGYLAEFCVKKPCHASIDCSP